MAQTARDFSDDQSMYTQVLFQRGRVVIDGELNEIGRLQRVSAYRTSMLDTAQSNLVDLPDRPTISNGFLIHTSTENPLGDGIIKITGNFYATHNRTIVNFRGYVWEIESEVELDLGDYEGPVDHYQVYVVIKEVEVDSAGDPTIKVSALGETAIRSKLDVQYKFGFTSLDPLSTDDSNIEPWQGGQRAGLIADVSRTGNSITAEQVHYRYRMPPETYTVNNSFFNGAARLRASVSSEFGGRVNISSDGTQLVFNKLSVLMGYSHINMHAHLISVNITLSIPIIDWAPGQALVLEMPSHPGTGTSSRDSVSEWEAVYDTEPGPNEVRLNVHKFAGWGFEESDSRNNVLNDLSNKVIVCAWLTGIIEGPTPDLEYDITFLDGRRLTFRDDSSNNVSETKEGLVWGYDDGLVQEAVLQGDNTRKPDQRGYAKGIRRPTSTFMKMFSQKIKDSFSNTIWVRWYVINGVDLDMPPSAEMTGSDSYGLAMTVNAEWSQNGAVGSWGKDVSGRGASIFYLGGIVDDSDNPLTATSSFIAQAHRSATKGGSWADDEWLDAFVNLGVGAMTAWDDKGNISAYEEAQARIIGYGSINLSGARDPASGSAVEPKTLYQKTIPKVAGSINVNNSAVVVVSADSLNILSASVTGEGANPGYIEILLATGMSNINRPTFVTIDRFIGSTLITDRLELVGVEHGSNGRVKVYIYDHMNSTWDCWLNNTFSLHLTMLGSN